MTTDEEIEMRKLSIFDHRRIAWATERRKRDNPHWGWTEIDYVADKLRQEMRTEIAAAGKPKRQRRRSAQSLESLVKEAVRNGATVRIDDVTVVPPNGVDQHEEDLRDLL